MSGAAATHTVEDTRRGWFAVASIALGTFVMVTSEFLPIGLLGPIARQLGVGEGLAGWMVTVPGLVAAAAAPAAASFARGVDRRILLLVLSALIVGADLIVANATSFRMALAGRTLLGLCVGGFWAFAVAAGRRLVPDAAGDRATAIVLAGISAGTVLGVPLATAIGNAAGWRNAFRLVALLALAIGAAQLFLLPRLPGSVSGSPRAWVALLRNRRLASGFAAAALVAGGHFMAYTYLGLFLSQSSRMSDTAIGLTLAAYGVAGIAGTFGGERLAVRDVRRSFVMVVVLLACAIAGITLAGQHAGASAVLISLWGLAFGAVPVCLQLWLFRAAPEQAEASSAFVVTVFQLALAAGAYGGGWLVDHAGLRIAYAGGALVALLALVPLAMAGQGGARQG
jgi:predicted MFS family arabinose efflux permease